MQEYAQLFICLRSFRGAYLTLHILPQADSSLGQTQQEDSHGHGQADVSRK